MTLHPLARAAGHLLGDEAVSWTPLHGGDLSEVVRLITTSGRNIVAKSGPDPEAEGAMLAAIRATGARAPEPLTVGPGVLVLEDAGPAASAPGPDHWKSLGETLRLLHDGGGAGDGFGWDRDYAFGPVVIRNGRHGSWPRFWIERRLLADASDLPPDLAGRIEALSPRIAAILPERPRPSLLHGDLWTGNVHFDEAGAAWLIDPASYHGHAEVDLAMLGLFGDPPPAFRDAYGTDPDTSETALRRAVYQLWPALVHLRLFGAGYRAMVERLLDRIAA
ncbi:fructosamine kinase family protein [Roseibacterium sp. SDUM158016]|uniref:fructosamine kinase family protein n=1 Tax=Roseicyclus sediminis TaxID=2980997 RepID=UPI0021CF9EA6|nr:fructosamine kinase family protein [Roseibacterium sp. SDUM158016]MCU4652760.1 fructosamine kinase family protein [Roseibacterium sp. SDUM158016]